MITDLIERLCSQIDDLEQKYHELIYAVENKHPNETRHETALRYIKACEITSDCTAEDISPEKE